MRVGFDMLYSQTGSARGGIGTYSFYHLTYLRMGEDVDPYFFCPKYNNLTRSEFVKHLTRFLVDNQIDILYLPSPMDVPYPDVYLSGELPDVRLMATVYDIIPLIFSDFYLPTPEMRDRYQMYLNLLKGAHHLLAISEHTRQDLINIGIPGDRITTISGGQDETYYPFKDADTEDLSRLFPAQLPFLLAFTPGDFRKNAERLVQAFAIAVQHRSEPWQLVFVNNNNGTPPPGALGNHWGVGDRVHHIGRVDRAQLLRLYNKASAVVMPTLYEGLGLPVLEAMQCGTPVLASDTSSLPEIVGTAAVLVNPNDTQSIANGLLEIMSSDEFRAQLAAQGFERAKHFDWKLVTERTIQSFTRVMQEVSVLSYSEQGYNLQEVLATAAKTTIYPEGAIVRGPNRFEIFLIEDGCLRHVTAPEILSLFHLSLDRVVILPWPILESLPKGKPIDGNSITAGSAPAGSLVESHGKVYLVDRKVLRHIQNPEIFNQLGLHWDHIFWNQNLENYTVGDPISKVLDDNVPNGLVLRTAAGIYYLTENRAIHHVVDFETLDFWQLGNRPIIMVTDEQLIRYTHGDEVDAKPIRQS